MNERLQQFLAAENINQAQFADSIGVARASVSHILAGRNKPGYDFIMNMMKRYPELNVEWLLSGKGKMYKNVRTLPGGQAMIPPPAAQVNLFDELPGIFEQKPAEQESAEQKTAERKPDIPSRESSVPVKEQDSPANTAASEGKNPGISSEHPVKQRTAVKIVIFYDDNTFQEF